MFQSSLGPESRALKRVGTLGDTFTTGCRDAVHLTKYIFLQNKYVLLNGSTSPDVMGWGCGDAVFFHQVLYTIFQETPTARQTTMRTVNYMN